MKKENTVEKEEDDWFWSSSSNPVLRLLQNKVMFLQKIMLIYEKPLLSSQPLLSRNVPVSWGWLLNGGSTVTKIYNGSLLQWIK